MLHPKALPPVFRQIEQKQYMNGTGVSESTVKVTFPHWQEPDRARGPWVRRERTPDFPADFAAGRRATVRATLVALLAPVLAGDLGVGMPRIWRHLAIW